MSNPAPRKSGGVEMRPDAVTLSEGCRRFWETLLLDRPGSSQQTRNDIILQGNEVREVDRRTMAHVFTMVRQPAVGSVVPLTPVSPFTSDNGHSGKQKAVIRSPAT